jgi:hypothetical protein
MPIRDEDGHRAMQAAGKAWKAIKTSGAKTWREWTEVIGPGLVKARAEAQSISNASCGKGYNAAMGALLEEYGFGNALERRRSQVTIARLVPQPGQNTSSHGVPAISAARIVGDHNMSRLAASCSFQRSTTAFASARATFPAACRLAPTLMSIPRVRIPMAGSVLRTRPMRQAMRRLVPGARRGQAVRTPAGGVETRRYAFDARDLVRPLRLSGGGPDG